MLEEQDHESWREYRKLVVSELERLDKDVKSLEKTLSTKLDSLREDLLVERERITAMRAVAGFIGFVSGILAAIVAALFPQP